MTRKFQTKISDPKLAAKLQSQYNVSDHIREVLDRYHKGELLDKNIVAQSFKSEKQRLECILLKIRIRKELIELGHAGTEAIDVANGTKQLTDNGLVTMVSQQTSEGVNPPEQKKSYRDHFCPKNKNITGFAFHVNKCPYCGEALSDF